MRSSLPQRPAVRHPVAMASALLLLACWMPLAQGQTVRFATFNVSLHRPGSGDLIKALSTPDNVQAQRVAETIQRADPDVLLLNEFDYDGDATAIRLFQQNYLGVGQHGSQPVSYPYFFSAPSNTGMPSGHDLDNNGHVGGGNDALGFGQHPGQYGMVLLSKYPIVENAVRTFQTFLWRDMPAALLPDVAATAEEADWYSDEELQVVRLSSKSHWDVALDIQRRRVHVLVAHPTPTVFDGPEDRNGRRNHDEIRFWADYVDPSKGQYIVDDQGGRGGLAEDATFVILGDYNADPLDGDSHDAAILQLLDNSRIHGSVTPVSPGGPEAARRQGGVNARHAGDPAADTADFGDTGSSPGNLRVDYVLPSQNMQIVSASVFWPTRDDPLARLLLASDHRLVHADVAVPEPSASLLLGAGMLAWFSTRWAARSLVNK